MPPANNITTMKQNCFFCGHPMMGKEPRIEIRDGEARQLTEYECTNPECKSQKVLDMPCEG